MLTYKCLGYVHAQLCISLLLFRDVIETCGDGSVVLHNNKRIYVLIIIFASHSRPTAHKEHMSEHLVCRG
jgi:hypothetical protein